MVVVGEEPPLAVVIGGGGGGGYLRDILFLGDIFMGCSMLNEGRGRGWE